jgi:4-diphosphocytidyl-2-C-methyl-D-erythritol kinase
MILFPNAKINLGLNIVAKRPDGFHNIETCFIPIEICDILEFVEHNKKPAITITGIDVPGNPTENICLKAWELLHANYNIASVKIHLHKNIPVGAGLGGGSADAAFMIKGLNDFFKLGLTIDQLEEYASKLGSDCAFFIRNTPAFAEGRGEILTPVKIDIRNYKIILVNPGIHVSTREAYSLVNPKRPLNQLMEFLEKPLTTWQHAIINDFEEGVFSKYPEIAEIKKFLIQQGAVYASMSGSGSSVYGIFRDTIPVRVKDHFKNMFVWVQE